VSKIGLLVTKYNKYSQITQRNAPYFHFLFFGVKELKSENIVHFVGV
jgi:hypothetical protein